MTFSLNKFDLLIWVVGSTYFSDSVLHFVVKVMRSRNFHSMKIKFGTKTPFEYQT